MDLTKTTKEGDVVVQYNCIYVVNVTKSSDEAEKLVCSSECYGYIDPTNNMCYA